MGRKSVVSCLWLVVSLLCVSAVSLYAGTWPDFSNEGNGSWVGGYYRPITITNSTGAALTDYQVAITPFTDANFINNTGLVASYHFSEGAGTTTADMSGNNNNGTWNGTGVHWTAGKFGNGAQFNGTDDAITVAFPSLAPLNQQANWTWSGWVYPVNSGGVYTEGIPQETFILYINPTNAIAVNIWNVSYAGNWLVTTSTNGAVSFNTWSYLTITLINGAVGSGTLNFYVNGQFISSTTGQQENNAGTKYAAFGDNIGAYFSGGQAHSYFSGKVDEVQIFNRALTGPEIQTRYNYYTKLKGDYSDVRFATAPPLNSGIELSYWQENDNKFWLKVPNLPTGTTTIYMYYGNTAAASAANGYNTFPIHFASFETSDDGFSGGTRVALAMDGLYVLQLPNGYTGAPSFTPPTGPYVWEMKAYVANTTVLHFQPQLRFITNGTNRTAAITPDYPTIGNWGIFGSTGGVNAWSDTGITVASTGGKNTWYNIKFIMNNDVNGTYSGYVGTTQIASGIYNSYTSNPAGSNVVFWGGNGITEYVDASRIRKYATPEPAATAPGTEAQYTLTQYVQSANWTSCVHAANPVAMGNAVAVISFTAVATGTATAHWRRFRIDETGGQPVSKLTVSVYEESGNDGFFDAADKFIASGTFNSNRTCYLNMNRWPLGTTPKTYYIVEKVAPDASGGQTIRLNIADGTYFDFEEGPCVGVPP